MRTPFLRPLNTEGGTLYVFPSVSKDLSRTFVSNDYEFKFSHFACLNLPSIYPGAYSEDSDSDLTNDLPRGIYLTTLGDVNTDDLGKGIAENLQNYVMNFETAILNGEGDNDSYDNDILTTVSEKVFFNWLVKVGGIKFESNDTVELAENHSARVVQYIGNIDVMNTVEVGGDAFEELYLYIPSTAGASTDIYFRKGEQTDNKNYLDKNYVIGGSDPETHLIGRDDNNPYGLGSTPIFDIDTGANIYTGDIGHTIDFRDSIYAGGDGINQMNANSLEDFEFNAILIYYDILKKTTSPGVKKLSTNLYGILFLDNVKTGNINDGGGYIQRYPKIKETVYGNGNGYALKIDLKVDTYGDSNTITTPASNPNNPVSMTLYTRALELLQRCIDMFYTQKQEIVKLTERVDSLENIVMGIDSISSIQDDVTRLYSILDSNGVVDTGTLLGLIDANSKKLDTIMNGGKDLKLQYDTDVLQPGTGIRMKKTLNSVVVSSDQKYAVNIVTNADSTNEEEIDDENPLKTNSLVPCNITLKPGENFAVIYFEDLGDSPKSLTINIVETDDCEWSVGQSMKIYFKSTNDGSLGFEDNGNNVINIKPTNGVILTIPEEEFEGNNLIEVICIDEGKFIYLIK